MTVVMITKKTHVARTNIFTIFAQDYRLQFSRLSLSLSLVIAAASPADAYFVTPPAYNRRHE